jgi:predicted nucleotidyltransferase
MGDRRQAALDARDHAQLDQVVELIHALLGHDAVAAYLYGSAVHGGLRPDSDIDVLVVGRRPTTAVERRQFIDRLLAISGRHATSGPSRSIELTIVVGSEVRPWRYPPQLDLQYGDWLRRVFERGDLPPWPTPNPDLAVLLTIVRRSGRALFGPMPAEILDPVPRADLERAMLDGIPDLLADLDSDTRNVILTLARIWTTMATGKIQPKDVAAEWALARLPRTHHAVLARARAMYLGEEPDRWDDLQPLVRPHTEYVVRQIRGARENNLKDMETR